MAAITDMVKWFVCTICSNVPARWRDRSNYVYLIQFA